MVRPGFVFLRVLRPMLRARRSNEHADISSCEPGGAWRLGGSLGLRRFAAARRALSRYFSADAG